MKIRTKLTLIALSSLVVVLAICVLQILSIKRMEKEAAEAKRA